MTLERLGAADDDFVAFVHPHLATVTWLAARLAPGGYEDVVQRGLTRGWHQRAQFDPVRTEARAWLCTVLVEQSKRIASSGADASGVGWGGAEWCVAGWGDADGFDADPGDFGRALALLTAPERRAVDCHYLVDLTLADTAVVMGCPVGTVGSVLAAARLRLRRALAPPAAGPVGARDDAELEAADPDDTDPEAIELGPIRAADRSIDALLRTCGAQFRADVPAVLFERPSSRLAMLGRRARSWLIGGVAATVVAIVVAGAAVVGAVGQLADAAARVSRRWFPTYRCVGCRSGAADDLILDHSGDGHRPRRRGPGYPARVAHHGLDRRHGLCRRGGRRRADGVGGRQR